MASIAFRADASFEMGTGHIMRCLALADEMARRGVATLFVTRTHAGHINEIIARHGHKLESIPPRHGHYIDDYPAHSKWLGSTWEEDFVATSTILTKHKISWLVVDHYGLEARWEAAMKMAGYRIFAIDDLADRKHTVDLLLDQNLNASAAQYQHILTQPSELLLGPKYALLRPEFAQRRDTRKCRPWPPRKVLVSMGGSDATNATALVAQAIIQKPLPGTQVQILIGPGYRHLSKLQSLVAPYAWITILAPVDNPVSLLAEADLAIGAAGTSAWERCCLGLPSVILSLAVNQDKIADALINHGAAIDGGRHPDLNQKTLVNALTLLDENTELSAEMSYQAAKLVDGRGVCRVADRLLH